MSTNHYDVIIVGSGLSGLSVAQFLKDTHPDLNVFLLEKEPRPGGAVRSYLQEEYQAEWGPHGFLDNNPAGRELINSVGLQDQVQLAPLGNFARFICRHGQLAELPQHPKKFLISPILSMPAKLRLLADLWTKPCPTDQTIGQWAGRRFGKAILPLVDAAITGTFAGDYEKLSIDAVMPGLRQLEKQYGSVLRGLKNKKKGQTAAKKAGLPAMQNFPHGMEQLTDALARGKKIQFQTEVAQVTMVEQGWRVVTADASYQADRLVLALPVNQALQLLTPLTTPPVPAIPVARLANVLMAYGPETKIPKAFGFLAPECEQRFCLGAMFSSAMFPDRCPQDTVLIEALVGGRRHPERLELNDAELVARVHADLQPLLNLPTPPRFSKVLRPAHGIPQLEMNHPALLTWRADLEGQHPNLHVIGFGWDGIGMNEMISAARKVADDIACQTRQAGGEKEVKPIYF